MPRRSCRVDPLEEYLVAFALLDVAVRLPVGWLRTRLIERAGELDPLRSRARVPS